MLLIQIVNTIFRRRPAWTDRILYRCNEYNVESMPLGLTSETYESHPSIRFSDHVPVSSTLTLSRFSDALARKKDLPAFNAIVRFLQPDNWRVGYDGIVRYFVEIGKMAYLNPWDYVALYKVIKNVPICLVYTFFFCMIYLLYMNYRLISLPLRTT